MIQKPATEGVRYLNQICHSPLEINKYILKHNNNEISNKYTLESFDCFKSSMQVVHLRCLVLGAYTPPAVLPTRPYV